MTKTKKTTAKPAKTKAKAAPVKAKAVSPKATAAKSVVAKSTKKPEPKVKLEVKASGKKGPTGKADKKSLEIEVKSTETLTITTEDEEEEETMTSTSSSSAAVSMAAATAEPTQAGSMKNFRQHPDIENFYRFIFENDLRLEAMEIIDQMLGQRETLKAVRSAKAKAN